mgnify:FL=1|jgi:hypothetical protein
MKKILLLSAILFASTCSVFCGPGPSTPLTRQEDRSSQGQDVGLRTFSDKEIEVVTTCLNKVRASGQNDRIFITVSQNLLDKFNDTTNKYTAAETPLLLNLSQLTDANGNITYETVRNFMSKCTAIIIFQSEQDRIYFLLNLNQH